MQEKVEEYCFLLEEALEEEDWERLQSIDTECMNVLQSYFSSNPDAGEQIALAPYLDRLKSVYDQVINNALGEKEVRKNEVLDLSSKSKTAEFYNNTQKIPF